MEEKGNEKGILAGIIIAEQIVLTQGCNEVEGNVSVRVGRYGDGTKFDDGSVYG